MAQTRDATTLLGLTADGIESEAWSAAKTMGAGRCERVFRQLSATPASDQRNLALEVCIRTVADHDRSRALALLALVSDPEFRQELTDNVVCGLMAGDPPATLAWLEAQPTPLISQKKLLSSLFYSVNNWGRVDPPAAIEFATRLPPGLQAEMSLTETFSLWSFDHPLDAMARAKALPDGSPLKNSALAGALQGLAHADPDQAKALVEEQLDAKNKEAQSMVITVTNMASGGIDWALALPNPSLRRTAVQQWVATQMTGNDMWVYDGTVPQTVTWADSLPANEARGAAWGIVATCWGMYAPDKAKDWLRSLPTGADRDEASAVYDQTIVQRAKSNFPQLSRRITSFVAGRPP